MRFFTMQRTSTSLLRILLTLHCIHLFFILVHFMPLKLCVWFFASLYFLLLLLLHTHNSSQYSKIKMWKKWHFTNLICSKRRNKSEKNRESVNVSINVKNVMTYKNNSAYCCRWLLSVWLSVCRSVYLLVAVICGLAFSSLMQSNAIKI